MKTPSPWGKSGALHPGRTPGSQLSGHHLHPFLIWSAACPRGSRGPPSLASSPPGLPTSPACRPSAGPHPRGPVPPSLPPDPGPTKAHRTSLPCRLLGRFWIFRFNNHKSGLGGVAANILFWIFSASVFEAQTVIGYRLGSFQQQIN